MCKMQNKINDLKVLSVDKHQKVCLELRDNPRNDGAKNACNITERQNKKHLDKT